jgi:HEPN domain-containing protein
MKKCDIKSSADMFLYKGTVDINAAKHLLTSFEKEEIDIDLEVIMFHLQQASEKLLKSLLSNKKVRVQKTHDIHQLIEMCHDNGIKLVEQVEFLEKLTDYAVEGRYTIIDDDLHDAEECIDLLMKLQIHTQCVICD